MVTDEQFQDFKSDIKGEFRHLSEDIGKAFTSFAAHVELRLDARLDARLKPIEDRLGRVEEEVRNLGGRFARMEGALRRAGDALSDF